MSPEHERVEADGDHVSLLAAEHEAALRPVAGEGEGGGGLDEAAAVGLRHLLVTPERLHLGHLGQLAGAAWGRGGGLMLVNTG